MANDLNQCTFTGRLGKDPELRYTASGSPVANFSIAVGETWKDKESGEKKDKTEWVNIVAWGRLAETAGEYLKKGARVLIGGKLQTRKWQDKDGNDRYTTEIVADQMQMLGGRSSGEGSEKPSGGSSEKRASKPKAAADPEQTELPDSNDPF